MNQDQFNISNTDTRNYEFDCFISHATEDKGNFVRPLAEGLVKSGLNIWYDEFTLDIGDSLRESIDKGLTKSRFGIVVLSKAFCEKNWPKYELNGLLNRQNSEGQKIIMPIWHNITQQEIIEYSPSIGDIIAYDSSLGIEYICSRLARKIKDAEPILSSKEVTQEQEHSTFQQLVKNEDIEQYIQDKKQIITALECFIVEERHKINLSKLVHETTEKLVSQLKEDFSTLMRADNPSAELIKDKMLSYDILTENLLTLLINGCFWGNEKQRELWIRSLQRIANTKVMNSGFTHLINLQYYPALLLIYGLGITAIAVKDYDLLKQIWLDTVIYQGRNGRKSIISEIYPGGVITSDILNQALGNKYYTPVSDHLYEIIRPEFSFLIPEDEQFSDIFDMFEYMFGLIFGYIHEEQNQRFWGPVGRFHWKYKWEKSKGPSDIINAIIEANDKNWAPLKAGLFGGNLESLTETQRKYCDLLSEIHWF